MSEPRLVLVTGGAGFIGSHVVPLLLARGHRVRVVDDLSTGRREHVPAEAHFVRADVTEEGVWDEAVEGVDAVVHLAAVASVARSVEDPLGTHDVNARSTIALAQAIARHGVGSIVYASTSAVYGDHDPGETGLAESLAPRPSTPYAIDKLAGEHTLSFLARSTGVRVTTLRFFNVYGPRQDPSSPYSGVIGIFAKRIVDGFPLLVHGDGLQSRDFVFVSDVADVVAGAVDAPSKRATAPGTVADRPVDDWGRAGDGSPVNVGTGRRTTLLDLISTLSTVTGRSATVQHGPERTGDVRHSRADVRKLTSLRGAPPSTPLSVGLATTVEWLRMRPASLTLPSDGATDT